jgi:hypothetical protein
MKAYRLSKITIDGVSVVRGSGAVKEEMVAAQRVGVQLPRALPKGVKDTVLFVKSDL